MSLTNFLRRTPGARIALGGPIAARRWWLRYRAGPVNAMLGHVEHLVTSDVQVRVAEFGGEFVLGPQSHLLHQILANGSYETDLAKLFTAHINPDRDVIDVGANVGFFTVLAGKHLKTGRVLAAEPTSAAFGRLTRNVEHNDVKDRVILFNGLVSDRESEQTVNIVPGREEYSSVGTVVHSAVIGQETRQEKIASRTLDNLVKEHGLKPALIKVDVEGAEQFVFDGAEETLKTHRPVVLSEFSSRLLENNGSSADHILRLFERCGYDVRDPIDPHIRPGSETNQEIIAIPRP